MLVIHQIVGTISISSLSDKWRDGDFKADVVKDQDRMNANGQVEWKTGQKLKAIVHILLPDNNFKEINLTVNINSKCVIYY